MNYVYELWRRPKTLKDQTTTFVLRWERADNNIYSLPQTAKDNVAQYDNVEWYPPTELLDGSSNDYDYRIKARRIL
jgi:hypothetical protein